MLRIKRLNRILFISHHETSISIVVVAQPGSAGAQACGSNRLPKEDINSTL